MTRSPAWKGGYVGAGFHHVAGDFVADDTGHLVGDGSPAKAPALEVPDQGETEAAGANPHQGLAVAGLGNRNVFQVEISALFFQYEGFHSIFSC